MIFLVLLKGWKVLLTTPPSLFSAETAGSLLHHVLPPSSPDLQRSGVLCLLPFSVLKASVTKEMVAGYSH